MTTRRPIAGKAARYLLTGGTAAVVDLAAFALLLRTGLPVAAAATLSFLVASVVNYWLSSRHVFGAPRNFSGYLRFLAAAVLGLGINVGLTTWLSATLPPLLAKLIAIAVAFLFNFTINLLVVFRTEDDARP